MSERPKTPQEAPKCRICGQYDCVIHPQKQAVKVIEGKVRCRECADFPGDKEKGQGTGECKTAKRTVYAMDYICELFKPKVK